MLQRETRVVVTDNTGATEALIIGMIGTMEKQVSIGDVVTVTIKKASPTGSVKVGQVVKALIVRTKKEIRRADGSYIRFGDNAVILLDIDNKGELKPKGKRITGPLPKELRKLYKGVTNLAPEVV